MIRFECTEYWSERSKSTLFCLWVFNDMIYCDKTRCFPSSWAPCAATKDHVISISHTSYSKSVTGSRDNPCENLNEWQTRNPTLAPWPPPDLSELMMSSNGPSNGNRTPLWNPANSKYLGCNQCHGWRILEVRKQELCWDLFDIMALCEPMGS